MTTSQAQLQSAITDEYMTLADFLARLPDEGWDTETLCTEWRVREVIAHVTMPVRYSAQEFQAELADCALDFTTLSNRIASRDGQRPTAALIENLRSELLHQWLPPCSVDTARTSSGAVLYVDYPAGKPMTGSFAPEDEPA